MEVQLVVLRSKLQDKARAEQRMLAAARVPYDLGDRSRKVVV